MHRYLMRPLGAAVLLLVFGLSVFSNINYGPPAQGSHAERYAWTVRAVAMFQRLKADAVPVRMAATLAVWQTAARVLDEESFEHAVRQAQATGDIRGILSFGHRPPKTKVR